jgi:xylan 1,4-beta-xylosidase
LCVRFDEWHHFEIEVAGGTVTARGAVARIRHERSCPAPSPAVTLDLECVRPTGSTLLPMLTSDIVVLSVSGGDPGAEKLELARLEGRYLSQETAASFTGRVIGLYAVSGEVTFSDFQYEGVES